VRTRLTTALGMVSVWGYGGLWGGMPYLGTGGTEKTPEGRRGLLEST